MINKKLVGFGIKYLAAKMDGKKTYFGGAVLVLIGLSKIITGAVGFIGAVYPDLATPMEPEACWQLVTAGGAEIGGGVAAFGIGHKIQKTTK